MTSDRRTHPRLARRLVGAILACALAACAGSELRQGLRPIEEARTFAVRPGMSAAALVEALGPPAERMSFPNLREQVWSWRFRDIRGEPMLFNAHLDSAGSGVRHTSVVPEITTSMEGQN